jgi:hypothetical protein
MLKFLKENYIPLYDGNGDHTVDDHINTMVRLSANSAVDPMIDTLHTLYCSEPMSEFDRGIALKSINEYLNTHYEVIDEFIVRKRRRRLKRPNSALSRTAKMRWKKNKSTYKRSMKKFHRSAKGKAFHRALTKFNSNETETRGYDYQDALDLCITATSALGQFFKWAKENKASEEMPPKEEIEDIAEIVNSCLNDLYSAVQDDLSQSDLTDTIEDCYTVLTDVFTEWDIDIEDNEE